MRFFVIAACLGLAACARTPVSDDVYSVEREAELTGDSVITPPPEADPAQAISSEELSAAGIPTSAAPRSPGSSTAAASANVDLNNPGISDEQSFEAVTARESIESDAARREAMQESYRVIEPEPLRGRPSDTGPNIVAYAINTTNDVGERVYSRSGFNARNRFNRNCAEYTSSDQAQRDFLARGGPQRDPRGLDPDGDGFACYWDPAAFRTAAGGAASAGE